MKKEEDKEKKTFRCEDKLNISDQNCLLRVRRKSQIKFLDSKF